MPEVNAISESRFVGEKEFKVNHETIFFDKPLELLFKWGSVPQQLDF